MAHISGDLSLCELFNSSGDVYVLLASRIFNKPLEGISKVEREQAKVICLGTTKPISFCFIKRTLTYLTGLSSTQV